MAYARESSTDKYVDYPGEIPDVDSPKRPDWVNLTTLDAQNETLYDKLLYKPALRFHGLTGGLWGQGLSGPQSVVSDIRPPSYKVKDPMAATYLHNDSSTGYDQSSLHNNAVSRLTLRKRNTIAVVLVAVALLAAIAAVIGVILHFIQPRTMLRANVRFTVANRNFTEEMLNKSSEEFRSIHRPLCGEMDIYYLTSELADFYYGCNVVSLRSNPGSDNVVVHYTLDFLDNKLTNNKERIKRVILNKSGRHENNDTLFLVIDDFWVYLRSLRVDLESVSINKRPQRPWIPWRNDIDFINRESKNIPGSLMSVLSKRTELNQSAMSVSPFTNKPFAVKHVLPNLQNDVLPLITGRIYTHVFNVATRLKALIVSSNVLSVFRTTVLPLDDNRFRVTEGNERSYKTLEPTKAWSDTRTVRSRTFELNELPIVREFQALRQERIEKYIDPVTLTENRRGIMGRDRIRGSAETISALDTSFNPIISVTSSSLTEALPSYTDKVNDLVYDDSDVIEDKKRVLSLYSDVFLIVGSENKHDRLDASEATLPLDTTPVLIRSSMKEHMFDHEFEMPIRSAKTATIINYNTHISNITSQQAASVVHTSLPHSPMSRQKFDIVVLANDIQNTRTTSYQATTLMLTSTVVEMVQQSESLNLNSNVDNVGDHISMTEDIELNEILVEAPIQHSIPFYETVPNNIQWVNILSIQDKVTSIKVAKTDTNPTLTNIDFDINIADDIAYNEQIDSFIHQIKHSHHQTKVTESISDMNYYRSELLTFPKEAFNFTISPESDVLLPANIGSNKNNIENKRKTATKQMQFRSSTHNSPHKMDTTPVERVFHDVGILHPRSQNRNLPKTLLDSPQHTGVKYIKNEIHTEPRRHDILLQNGNAAPKEGLHPEFHNSSHTLHNTFLTEERLRNNHLQSHPYFISQFKPGKGLGAVNFRHVNKPETNRLNRNQNFRRKTFDTFLNVRTTDIFKTQNGHFQNTNGMNRISNGQPWLSYPITKDMSRVSNKLILPYRKMSKMYNNFGKWYQYPVKQYSSDHTSGRTWYKNMKITDINRGFVANPSSLWTNKLRYSKFIKPSWKNVIVPWAYYYTPLNTGRRYMDPLPPDTYYSKKQMFTNQILHGYYQTPYSGLSESYNISDIYEMKEILKHLIDSMHTMSNKLDKMQAAINFINQTLHETKQPIHKLENTFENMTMSFDNFDRNLNDITDILNEFKIFLRPFANTIFNIDDIIANIDRTVNNLAKTRTYVGDSMTDLSDSVNSVTGTLTDLNSSLKHVNMSVFHVNTTATYTNRTLDSMEKTLETLDAAIRNMNLKIGGVKEDIEGINVSLSTINKTVHTSHNRLVGLQRRINTMNGTVKNIKDTIEKLNGTYTQINETLRNMNEPIMVTEGTILEVIGKLNSIDSELLNISSNMVDLGLKVDLINDSMDVTLQWMAQMLLALNKFNVTIEASHDTVSINLNNIDMIDTIGVLIKLNNTLHAVEDHINNNKHSIDTIEFSLNGLEDNLVKLKDMLENMDYTFNMLNETLKDVNSTLNEIRHPLQTIKDNVERIDYSFDDLDESFKNINKTLQIANRTLEKVDQAREDIHLTLDRVRDDLSSINRTVKQVTHSVLSVNNSLTNMGGPLKNMKNELLHTKETLNVLKDKVNTTLTSFDSVRETLTDVNMTFTELVSKLGETKRWLERTNNSLRDVNNTIDVIDRTYEEMSDTLKDIYLSFNSTIASLEDFRTSFPTLQKKVDITANRVSNLQDELQKINNSLFEKKLKRNQSASTYNDMILLFKDVFKGVLKEQDEFQTAIEYADTVEKSINELVDLVNSTQTHYSKLERNVDILDNSLDKLKLEHDSLLSESGKLKNDINMANVSLLDIEKKKAEAYSLAASFSSLRIPSDEIHSLIERQKSVLNETKDSFSFWEYTLENINGKLWDENGYPVNIHDNSNTITQTVDSVNTTLTAFEIFAKNSSKSIANILRNKRKLDDLFGRINETTIKIDKINTQARRIGDELNSTKERMEKNEVHLNSFEQELYDKISVLKDLKDNFSKVNGTTVVSEKFHAVDGIINNIETQIQSLKSQARNASQILLEVELKSTFVTDSFNKTPVFVDDEGNAFLENTIDTLKETDSLLDIIDSKINDIENSNMLLNISMNRIDRYTEILQQFLTNKTEHFNFIKTNRPALIDNFEKMDSKFANKTYILKNLRHRLNELNTFASNIENRTSDMPNVDMSINTEKRLINTLEMSVSELENEVEIAFQKYESAKNNFQHLNHSGEILKSVQNKYSNYQNILNGIDRILTTFDIETSLLDRRMDDLVLDFSSVSMSIDSFYAMKKKLFAIGNSLNSMELNMEDTGDKIELSTNKIRNVTATLHDLKKNFAHSSGSSFNISHSPVNDEVKYMMLTFEDISGDFNENIQKGNTVRVNFNETVNKILHAPLSRYNISRLIDKDTDPTSNIILADIINVNDSLNDVKSRLHTFDIDIRLINNTLNLNNEQLVMDEKKKQLADEQFPHLEYSVKGLSDSLRNIMDSMSRPLAEYNNTLNAMENIFRIIDTIPTIDISDTGHRNSLKRVSDILHDSMKELRLLNDLLVDVNSTIWTNEDKRYSHNETISDITERYAESEKHINVIEEGMRSIKENVGMANFLLTNTSKALTALNSTLFEFQSLDNVINDFLYDLMMQENESHHTFENIKLSDKLLKSLETRVKDTAKRFSHINQAILQTGMHPINVNISYYRENIKKESNKFDYIRNTLNSHSRKLNDIRETMFQTISDPNVFPDIINYTSASLKDLNSKVMSTKKDYTLLQNRIKPLDHYIEVLNHNLDSKMKEFYRQEKLEFYQKFFNLTSYNEIGDQIKTSNMTNKILSEILDKGYEHLNKLNKTLSDTDRVELTLDEIVETLDYYNISLAKLEKVIGEMESQHTDIFSYFKNKDGYEISDSETIKEMKERFKKLNDSLKLINEQLTGINLNQGKHAFEKLTAQNKFLIHAEKQLNNLQDASNTLNEFDESLRALNVSLDSIQSKHKKHALTYADLEEELKYLESTFEGVHNSKINNSKDHVHALKSMISNAMNAVQNEIVDDLEDFHALSKVIEDINVTYKDGFKTVENIDIFLKKINDMKTITHAELSHTNRSLIYTNEKIDKNEWPLSNLNESLNLLRSHILRQEKHDFVKTNAPYIQNQLNLLKDSMRDSSERITLKENQVELLKQLLDVVQEQINNDSLLELKLNNVTEIIQTVTRNLIKERENIALMNTTLNSINSDMFNPDSSYFGDKDTLFDIKLAYAKVNETLIASNQSLADASDYLLTAEQLINESNSYLSSLRKEVNNGKEIKKNANSIQTKDALTGDNLNSMDSDLLIIGADIKQLDKQLQSIEDRFFNVTDVSLLHQRADIESAINTLHERHAESLKRLDEKKYQHSESNINVEKLKNIMSRKSYSFGELKNKHNKSENAIEAISSILNDLDKQIKQSLGINTNMKDGAFILSEKLNDLEFQYTEKQMNQFVNATFPSILERIEVFENVLQRLANNISDAINLRENISTQMQNLTRKADKIDLNISMTDLVPNYNAVLENSDDAKTKQKALKTDLHNFVMSLNSDVRTNETLNNISKRFQQYTERLNTMFDQVIPVDNQIRTVQSLSNQAHTQLKQYNYQLGNYENESERLNVLKEDAVSVARELTKTVSKLKEKELEIKYLQVQMNYIEEKFRHVNDSDLDEVKQMLQSTISQLGIEKDMLVDRVNDLKMEIGNVDSTLDNEVSKGVISVPNLSELQSLSKERANLGDTVEKSIQKVNAELSDLLKKSLPNVHARINDTNSLVTKLINKYEEEEKRDYIERNLPNLLNEFDTQHQLLANTKSELDNLDNKIIALNKSIHALENDINNIPNVYIPLRSLKYDIHTGQENRKHISSILDTRQEKMKDVDLNQFSPEKLQTLRFKELKNMFGSVNRLFSDTNESMNFVAKTVDAITGTVNETEQIVSETNEFLTRYTNIQHDSDVIKERLMDAGKSIGNTSDLLSKVNTAFDTHSKRLRDIQQDFGGIRNQHIDHLYDTANELISFVDLRLPLVNELYKSKTLSGFEKVSNELNNLQDNINTLITDRDKFKEVLDSSDLHILNITNSINNLLKGKNQSSEEGMSLIQHLDKFDQITNELERSLKEQRKRDLLQEQMPLLTSHFLNTSDETNKLKSSLNKTLNNLEMVKFNFQSIDHKMRGEPSLQIPLNDSFQYLENAKQSLNDITADLMDTKQTLNTIPIYNIDIEQIITNESISISDVNDIINNIRLPLSEVDNVVSRSNNRNRIIDSTIEEMMHDADQLQQTVNDFFKTETAFERLNSDLQGVNIKRNISANKLLTANETISSLKSALEKAKFDYAEYNPDDSRIQSLVQNAEKMLQNITDTIDGASNGFELVNDEFSIINSTLYRPSYNRYKLNNTLNVLKDRYQGVNEKMDEINGTFDNIINHFTPLDNTLGIINSEIKLLNMSLKREDDKSTYIKETLPELKKKYANTNYTFSFMNKTFNEMESKLKGLEDFVDKVKSRMDLVHSINISMSNVTANLTRMENQLIIIKDSYKNTKDIVSNLQRDLEAGSYFGTNVSLQNISDLFSSYNLSIDDVDMVLGKIDMEFTEMDQHFGDINDTLTEIDTALDSFNDRDRESKLVHAEILNISHTLSEKDQKLLNMKKIITDLNTTFENLQNMYTDVFTTTAGKTSLFKEALSNASNLVDNVQRLLNTLNDHQMDIQQNYRNMNETLNQEISSSNIFFDVLTEVELTYDKIIDSLDILFENVSKAKNQTSELNSFLSSVSTMLNDITDTLHDEQIKHDYIISNLNNFESELDQIENGLKTTKKSLLDSETHLENTTSFVANVRNRMLKYPTVNFGIENKTLSSADQTVSDMNTLLDDMNNTFWEAKASNSLAEDSARNMSELNTQYYDTNETLKRLNRGIVEIGKNISAQKVDINKVRNKASEIYTTLNAFDKIEVEKNDILYDVDKLSSNKSDLSLAIGSITKVQEAIKAKIKDLNNMYEHVETAGSGEMLNNLKSLTDELQTKVLNLKSLNDVFNEFEANFTTTHDNSKHLEKLLQNQLHGFDQLKYVTNTSQVLIPEILNGITDLHSVAHFLNANLSELEIEVDNLHTNIHVLNESLFEEKQKEEFIKNNFKRMNQTFSGIEESLVYSNSTIALTLANTAGISDGLTQLSMKLDRFSAINISLDSERNLVAEERKKLEDLMELYKNVSESQKRLDVDSLKHTNKSFKEIKHDYGIFEHELKRLEDGLRHINETVAETNNRLGTLQTNVNDINDTVDNYKQMERLISDKVDTSTDLNDGLVHSNEAANDLEKQIKYINETLKALEDTFRQIKDPKLKSFKDHLEGIVKKFSADLDDLKINNGEMDTLTSGIKKQLDSANNTLHSTKIMLDTLKDHIQVVNQSSALIANNLKDVQSMQSRANNTASRLKPGLDRILQDLHNLTKSFEYEQDKFDFITKNKPILEAKYKSLEKELNDINKRISVTDLQLADLRYAIKTTGDKLVKFKTLDITTNPEMDAWTERSNQVSVLSSKFVRLSSKYNILKGDIQQLQYMNSTDEELKIKVKTINQDLLDIKLSLQEKNDTLKIITNDNIKTESVLNDLNNTMIQFKEIELNVLRTKELMEKTYISIANSSEAIGKVTLLKELIDGKIRHMEQSYSSIIDSAWAKELSMLKRGLSFEEDKLKMTVKNLRGIEDIMNTTRKAFTKTYTNLTENSLTRNNVKENMKIFERNIRTMNKTFMDSDGQIKETDNEVSVLNNTLNGIWAKVSTLNESLFLELEKASYVNDTLPGLQQKLFMVNGTFAKNLPSAKALQSQVSYLTVVLDNIQRKMNLYGFPDNNDTVKEWRQMLLEFKTKVNEIDQQNEHADQTLADLRLKLWTEKPMYTRIETLDTLQRRFEEFNRTLNDIKLSSYSINLNLNMMNMNATSLASEMENKDAMLTTTTTPAAPPDWLSFTSSGTGTIAVDRGMLECAAKDLTHWDIMKITRVDDDGKQQDLAAWKQDAGARKSKTLTDRRIRVKRVLDNQGGGKLQVGITSIQCVDEATYLCSVDSHNMWPLKAQINVISPPEDTVEPDFPTEVFEDKVANFSCTGRPGYPNGRIKWKVRHQNEAFFSDFKFYSSKSKKTEQKCTRTETITVGYQFDMKWNNTRIRCYIENTDFFGEGIIRILPYSICNNVRDLGKIRHPYTPHKYIVCDRGLNIMQCPGKTCYDQNEENCVTCKASVTGGDPCRGQPLFSYVAHETDCRKYYLCMGPTTSNKKCAKGYYSQSAPGHCVQAYNQSECGKKLG